MGLQLVGFYPPLDLVGRLAPVHHLDLVLETSVRTGAGDLPPVSADYVNSDHDGFSSRRGREPVSVL